MDDSPDAQATTADTTAIDHILATTRAVRRRLDLTRPVEPEVISECLRLAVQAPTASNVQDWRWMVVTDPKKRAGLAEIYRETGEEYLSRAAANATDPQTKRVYASAVYLADIIGQVPVHVIPCIDRRVDNAPNSMAAAAYGSIIPAAWSFLLALRARGLGSVWTTLHLMREKEAANLLGIPEHITQVALLPVAYTTGGDFKPAARPPIAEITFWNEWGEVH
jgi:nitroreductase